MEGLPRTVVHDFFFPVDNSFSFTFVARDSFMATFALLFSRNLPSMEIIVVGQGAPHLRPTFRRLAGCATCLGVIWTNRKKYHVVKSER